MNRILIVEDEVTIAKATKIFLEDENYQVKITNTVDQAEEFLKSKQDQDLPDLILLDIIMPGKHGTELLKIIKENERYSRIKTIVLTIVSPLCGIRNDINKIDPKIGFLEKPYRQKQLLDIVKKKLNN